MAGAHTPATNPFCYMKDYITPTLGAAGFTAAISLRAVNEWLEFGVLVLTFGHLVYKLIKRHAKPRD